MNKKYDVFTLIEADTDKLMNKVEAYIRGQQLPLTENVDLRGQLNRGQDAIDSRVWHDPTTRTPTRLLVILTRQPNTGVQVVLHISGDQPNEALTQMIYDLREVIVMGEVVCHA